MPTVRHIFVCEGYSERAYIRSLQAFLDKLPVGGDAWGAPLGFIAPNDCVADGGHYTQLRKCYLKVKKRNRNVPVHTWTDFDLFHRDDGGCSRRYAGKGRSLPDFHFSFHNFEDFLALHLDGEELQTWLRFGSEGHFDSPQSGDDCFEWACSVFKGYRKGELPLDFISAQSLRNLKANLHLQPRSNPRDLQGIKSFAEFIIGEVERFHPDILR